MAQFIRTKKLTDVAYSPTFAISEATRRAEVDGSIQEIADVLYSTTSGKGASQVGLEGGAYANVQLLSNAVQDVVTGFVPLDLSVTNNKLATDVKVGSLATLSTTTKASVVAAINEILTTTSLSITTGFAAGWSGTITVRKSLLNVVSLSASLTKSSDITATEIIVTMPLGVRPLDLIGIAANRLEVLGSPVASNNTQMYIYQNGEVQITLSGTSTNARRLEFTAMYYSA